MQLLVAKEFAMRRLAFLTTLVLAGSGRAPAFADPNHRFADRENSERYDRSHRARDFHGRWFPLATRYSANEHRQFINIRGAERLDKLRIEADRGAPVINQIAIQYTD